MGLFWKSITHRLIPGPFYDSTAKEDEMSSSLAKGQEIINGVFLYFEKNSNENWKLGMLWRFWYKFRCRTLLSVLSNIIKHIEYKENIDASITSPEELVQLIKPYLKPLSDYINELSVEEIKGLRSSSSLGKVTANSSAYG